MIVGLTRYAHKGHFARAALEATAYQSREILDAMGEETGRTLTRLQVDGGMVKNDTLMQFQADISGVPVIRPHIAETTTLGAAYVAGLAVRFWQDTEELRQLWTPDRVWEPRMDEAQRDHLFATWRKAVTKTYGWIDSVCVA